MAAKSSPTKTTCPPHTHTSAGEITQQQQWKLYCLKHGFSLTQNSVAKSGVLGYNKKGLEHKDDATFCDKEGGNVKKDCVWQQWFEQVTINRIENLTMMKLESNR